MANGACSQYWKHTSALLATLININRSKGTSPVKPGDIDPYSEVQQNESGVDMEMKPSGLAAVLFGKKR
jgi:hypothetical protein